jgi:hypothetical protein
MKVLPHWIAGFLTAGIVVATAAPLVPSSEMPGRERDRFTTSPVERFMGPGPYVPAPVVVPSDRGCAASKRNSKQRSSRHKHC